MCAGREDGGGGGVWPQGHPGTGSVSYRLVLGDRSVFMGTHMKKNTRFRNTVPKIANLHVHVCSVGRVAEWEVITMI